MSSSPRLRAQSGSTINSLDVDVVPTPLSSRAGSFNNASTLTRSISNSSTSSHTSANTMRTPLLTSPVAPYQQSPFEDIEYAEERKEHEYPQYQNLQATNDDDAFSASKTSLRCACCFGGCQMSRRRYICMLSSIITFSLGFFILLVFSTILPEIIKSQMSHSNLNFDTIEVNGTPTETRLKLQASGSITNLWKVKAKTADAILRLYRVEQSQDSLVLPSASTLSSISRDDIDSDDSDNPAIGHMLFPALTCDGDISFNFSSLFHVDSSPAFHAWLHDVIFQSQIQWSVKSSFDVTPYVFGVPLITYPIDFEKTITLQGCAGLTKNVHLVSFNMRSSTKEELRVNAIISLENPSPFSLHPIGQLTFDFFYQGKKQGVLVTDDTEVMLNAGENIFSLSGVFDPDASHPNVTREFIGRYLTGHESTVYAKPAVVNGSSIPLYNEVIQGLSLPSIVPGLNTSLISHVVVLTARMIPSEETSTIEFDMDIEFQIDSPLGESAILDVYSIIMAVSVGYQNNTTGDRDDVNGGSVELGTLSMTSPASVSPHPSNTTAHRFISHMYATFTLTPPLSNYVDYVRTFVAAEGMVPLQFTGFANVSAGYLYGPLDIIDLPISITIDMQGGGGLKDTEEKSLQILGNRATCEQPPLCGVDLIMNATIFNPSILTLNLSNAWFDLYYKSIRVGSLEILPLYMISGYNPHITARGYLNPAQEDLGTIGEFMSHYVAGKNQTLEMRGNGIMVDGDGEKSVNTSAHALTLAGLAVNVTANGLAMELLHNFSITAFILQFHGKELMISTTAHVTAHVALPPSLNIPMNITSSGLDLNILTEGVQLGVLTVDRFPITYEPGSNTTLFLDFDSAHFQITNVSAFEKFAGIMVSNNGLLLTLDGFADPIVDTGMGELHLTHIHQRDTVLLAGYNSFLNYSTGNSLLHVNHLDILSATRGSINSQGYEDGGFIQLSCNVSLTNPSQVAIRGLGLFEMDIYFQSLRIVTVQLTNFTVELGVNEYTENCFATFWSPLIPGSNFTNQLIARQFLSDYLNGHLIDISMYGKILQADGSYQPGISIPLLQPAFEAFTTSLSVEGNKAPFISHLTVAMNLSEAIGIFVNHGGVVMAQAMLYNPFSSSITVTHLNLSVLAGNTSAPLGGWLVPNQHLTPIYLPPYTAMESAWLPVYLKLTAPVWACLLDALTYGIVGVSLVGEVEVWVGTDGPGQPNPKKNFNQTMDAFVNLIPTTIKWPNVTTKEDIEQLQQLYQSHFIGAADNPPGTCPPNGTVWK